MANEPFAVEHCNAGHGRHEHQWPQSFLNTPDWLQLPPYDLLMACSQQDAGVQLPDPLSSESAATTNILAPDMAYPPEFTTASELHAAGLVDSGFSAGHTSKEGGGIPMSSSAGDTDFPSPLQLAAPELQRTTSATRIKCWQHGCRGRTFSLLSNYRRHCKEKDGIKHKAICPRCGQRFSRKAALKIHHKQWRCKITQFDFSGIPFSQPLHQVDRDRSHFECREQ